MIITVHLVGTKDKKKIFFFFSGQKNVYSYIKQLIMFQVDERKLQVNDTHYCISRSCISAILLAFNVVFHIAVKATISPMYSHLPTLWQIIS